MNASPRRHHYWQAARTPHVWRRAAKLGLVVGLIQVSINQGDHWLHDKVTLGVVVKTIVSPLFSFAIAFISCAITHAENFQRSTPLP